MVKWKEFGFESQEVLASRTERMTSQLVLIPPGLLLLCGYRGEELRGTPPPSRAPR